MNCHYCGGELKEKQMFCSCCGTRRQEVIRKEILREIQKDTPKETPKEVLKEVRKDTRKEVPKEAPKEVLREVRKENPAKVTAPEEEFPVIRPILRAKPEPEQEEVMPTIRPVSRPTYVPYGAPEERKRPAIQLPTKRSLAKMVFLGLLTLGIYPTVIWFRIVTELNIAASRYDGERTMSCFGAMALTGITLGIYPLIWIHGLCNRIGAELKRRDLAYEFGASTFWLWNVLGAFILVGPFIFTHKLMKSMNLINDDFNING